VVKRGEIWWADLPEPVGAGPGYRRPVLIVSDDDYNQTTIQTVIVLSLTSNLKYARLANNIYLSKDETGLSTDSVINITQLGTIDRTLLEQRISNVSEATLFQLNESLKQVLGIW
jgi:mRNA interferase MazF